MRRYAGTGQAELLKRAQTGQVPDARVGHLRIAEVQFAQTRTSQQVINSLIGDARSGQHESLQFGQATKLRQIKNLERGMS